MRNKKRNSCFSTAENMIESEGDDMIRYFNRFRKYLIICAAACVFLFQNNVKAAIQPSDLTVHFIDVGEGDSILLTCGKEAMMVDFGIEENRNNLLDYIKKQRVKILKYAVGTHPHEDHMGAMSHIINKIPTKGILLTKCHSHEPFYLNTLKVIRKYHIPVIFPRAGKRFRLGKARIKVLAPLRTGYKRKNDYSLVLKVTYKKTSFLLMGDAEKTSEREMLKKYRHALKSTVLKVGHHGANTSSTKKFIQAVSPDCAVISTGPNPFGHPGRKALFRFRRLGIKVRRTDLHGTIIARTDGQKIYWSYK